MADFTGQFQNLKAFPFLDLDQSMGLMNQFKELNPTIAMEDNLLDFSRESFFHQQFPEFPENFSADFVPSDPIPQPVERHVDDALFGLKRKPCDMSGSSSENSSTHGFHRQNNLRKGKRAKCIGKSEPKKKDVVHVRARRGQATDSHSLAERVRRGKINERLRCLQDIVPGCYKSMGMAVMLDEIINYVQSLQNQVEFLSMKLTTASTFYDFNSESDAIEEMQRAKAYGATKPGVSVAMNDGNASQWPF